MNSSTEVRASISYPIEVPALRVEQPIGVYYVAILPAEVLLQVAFSHVMQANINVEGSGYDVDGTQRLPQPKRMPAIRDYINRADSAFPNSIIIAANYRSQDGLIEDDDSLHGSEKRWSVEERESGCCTLRIPTAEKLAAIIDGQHRLFAFADADPNRLSMSLICSVFLDLPKPFQAQLFATINSTQKPVDKSLTYELFGYNLDEESEQYWSPDKLAVFLTRKLGTEEGSPLKGRIAVAPRKDQALERLAAGKGWKISTAVVVEGIMRLFSTNPKKDGSNLLDESRRKRKDIADLRRDKSPLRQAYIDSLDAVLYTMVLNYLVACQNVFWDSVSEGSYIIKTVGVQALFDVLKSLSLDAYSNRDISVSYFQNKLAPAARIDFSAMEFRNASGSGRTAIRKAIESVLE